MVRRLLCWLFNHVTPPGVRRELSIFFVCQRCGEFCRGTFNTTRRKRK